MTIETLRAELETLPFDARLRRMIALGRESRTDTESEALLQSLGESDEFYARHLRLLSCIGSRDGAYVCAQIEDESRLLRGIAASLLPLVCSDEQAITALESAGKRLRITLLRGLYRRRRVAVIDRFLERLARQGDTDIGRWLVFGSESFVRGRLDRALPRLGLSDWGRLTRRHPDLALAAVRQRVQIQTEPDARLRGVANIVLQFAAVSRSDGAILLARELLKHEAPSRVTLQPLITYRPDAVADLLLAQADGEAAMVRFDSVASRLSGDRLLALLRRFPLLFRQPRDWFSRLSPDTRRAVFETAGVGWRSDEGIVDTRIVAALPADGREKEARRHGGLPALATRPASRLPYAAFLPFDEARDALIAPLGSPDPDLRAVALSAQIGAARYHPDRLSDVLSLVRTRRNEQDPIRRAMLSALAGLPPSRWTESHVEDLGQILQDTLDAADLSPATIEQASSLVIRLMPFYPDWAVSWIGNIVQARGQISFPSLEDRVTDSDMTRLAPILLPVFAAWKAQERDLYLIRAAGSLGRRLRVFPGLVEILADLAHTTKNRHTADQALMILWVNCPERLDTLVPSLLESDKSAITLTYVYWYLHQKRQDLLTSFLGSRAYSGRFGTGNTVFVLPLSGDFYRWTPTQQTLFSQTLTRLASETERDLPTRQQAVSRLVQFPDVVPLALFDLARESAKPSALRDEALRALARFDAGQGIPALTDALGDSRARIAIYALRSAIGEMPADRALALLQSVPMEKVTVAKEVIRLLGEVDSPAAYPLLLERDVPSLHRDVRVALLRALWEHLETETTWPLLESAAADSDPAVAGGVVRIPTDRLSPTAQQRLLHLQMMLLQHPTPDVRLQTLRRCIDLPLPDPARLLLSPLLTCLGSPLPDETDAAARAVFSTYIGGSQQDSFAIGAAVVQIKTNRRVLQATLAALHTVFHENRGRLRATVRAVLDALADDPLTAEQRAVLAIAGLPWDAVTEYLARLAQTGELHPAALVSAAGAITSSRHGDGTGDAEAGLQLLESAFASHGDERLRYLAFAALIARADAVSGWTGELRRRLETYRADLSPLVAAAAQFHILPPAEPPDSLADLEESTDGETPVI